MNNPRSIARLLAEPVIESRMPFKAVAIAGELIIVEAQLSDYPMRQGSLEEIVRVCEGYDFLLKQIEALHKDFV